MNPVRIGPAIRIALAAASAALTAGEVPAQAPLFPADRDGTSETLQSAFSCPLGRLTDLYSALAEAAEVLDVMSVETEVLVICRTRQERLRAVAEAELELRKLFGLANPAAGAARISIMDAADGQAPIIVDSCPEPPPIASAGQAEPEAAESVPMPEIPTETVDRSGGIDPVPGGTAPAPVAELLSALLTGLADAPEADGTDAGGSCSTWSWAWTGRDHSRRQSAMLVSPEGLRREVAVGDRLSGRLTVAAITPAGVTVDDGTGNLIRLPPSAGGAVPGDRDPDAVPGRLQEIADDLPAPPGEGDR